MKRKRFVFDTNSFISAALLSGSVNSRAIDHAFNIGEVVVSAVSFAELTEVIFRKKFDKYLAEERRLQILQKLELDTHLIEVNIILDACRDPKDNKFLELAVEAGAACLITGDKDLLVLNPFQNIPILTASEFLEKF
jgi:putative PIN family toxin of toxin-antitoxin system